MRIDKKPTFEFYIIRIGFIKLKRGLQSQHIG
jgi:hypothetical protein